jgi:hypothetical protein
MLGMVIYTYPIYFFAIIGFFVTLGYLVAVLTPMVLELIDKGKQYLSDSK